MSSQLTCPECGSSLMARSQQDEGFVCMNCKHIIPYGEAEEEFKYSLDLVDCGLTEIPDWVYERKYLKEIDLSAEPDDPFHAPFVNRISAISSGIGQLTDLEELDISSNIISGIPPEIAKCQNLRYLYLGRNYIKEFPEELCNLSKLDSLNLRYNGIESLPSCIGRLTNLTWLSLSGNLLESFPEEIRNLANLETLLADENKIKKLPYEIGFLKNLLKLNLSYNLIESLPDEIGLLTNLKTLNLENNKLRSLPESIIYLTNLEDFSVSGNINLTSPPYNVAMQGLEAIRDWFDKTESNK
jgi:hypothetical protein